MDAMEQMVGPEGLHDEAIRSPFEGLILQIQA
jgi:hypothetical protein